MYVFSDVAPTYPQNNNPQPVQPGYEKPPYPPGPQAGGDAPYPVNPVPANPSPYPPQGGGSPYPPPQPNGNAPYPPQPQPEGGLPYGLNPGGMFTFCFVNGNLKLL